MLKRSSFGAVIITLVGCGNAGQEPGEATASAAKQAFHNDIKYVNCSDGEKATIASAAEYLRHVMFDGTTPDPHPFRRCLADGFLSRVEGGGSYQDLEEQFLKTVQTTIECSSVLDNACDNFHDWSACAKSYSSETMVLSTQMLDKADFSIAGKDKSTSIAAIMAHELAHNHGHKHANINDANADPEFASTVPARAFSCALNGNNLPAGESRTAGMPGEVELGYVGRFGGYPWQLYGAGDKFVSAIHVGPEDPDPLDPYQTVRVKTFATTFTSASNPADHSYSRLVGGFCKDGGGLCYVPPPEEWGWLSCDAGEIPVGIHGQGLDVVYSLGLMCESVATKVVRKTGAIGGITAWPFESKCPEGKAIRGIRGRNGSLIDQIQITCDDYGRNFADSHVPHTEGPAYGSQSDKKFIVRCSGNGALSGLTGRANALIQRLGGTCQPTTGNSMTRLVAQGPEHAAAPYVGGLNTSYPYERGALFRPNHCAAQELMVGVKLRSGSALDNIQAICAQVTQWDQSTPQQPAEYHVLPDSNGGTGGQAHTQLCPPSQFMVGYDVWAGNSINGIQVVCANLRSLNSGPCDGLCDGASQVTIAGSYNGVNLGTDAVCLETTSPVRGGNCGNLVDPRTLRVNGATMTCNNLNWPDTTIPMARNGGYCVQMTPGYYSWAFLTLW